MQPVHSEVPSALSETVDLVVTIRKEDPHCEYLLKLFQEMFAVPIGQRYLARLLETGRKVPIITGRRPCSFINPWLGLAPGDEMKRYKLLESGVSEEMRPFAGQRWMSSRGYIHFDPEAPHLSFLVTRDDAKELETLPRKTFDLVALFHECIHVQHFADNRDQFESDVSKKGNLYPDYPDREEEVTVFGAQEGDPFCEQTFRREIGLRPRYAYAGWL